MHDALRRFLLGLAMILTVPAYDGEWPTLGFDVVAWMQDNLVHGPGDIRGETLHLDDEKVGFILRMYEVFPRGHEQEGRRRFDRCGLSVAKGSAKTELGALVSAAELHPSAPVRWAGWNADGTPQGRGVTDAFLALVAFTEEQSDELAYGALRVILQNSKVADDFDIGLERIVRKAGDGKAVSLASSPGARDGARTTFQLFDETHRFTTPELRKAHQTMLANIPKRAAASDPWSLELTTAFDPSEASVARSTMNYARSVHDGKQKNSRLFFFHRQASEDSDLTTIEGRTAAVIEARGPHVTKWAKPSGIASIVSMWDDPEADKDYLARVWLNQIRHANARAFDLKAWEARRRDGYVVAPGAHITLGFDGAQTDDATALIGTEIVTGFQWPLGIWERPLTAAAWQIDEARVDEAVADAFERYQVWRMYADPWFWQSWLATWAGRHGDDRVVNWPTNKWLKMAHACRAYANAMAEAPVVPPADPVAPEAEAPEPPIQQPTTQRLSHNGDPVFTRHIGNAHKMLLGSRDEKGERLWVVQKERKDSPNKMDAAPAGILSWQARLDAIAKGVGLVMPPQSYAVEWVG